MPLFQKRHYEAIAAMFRKLDHLGPGEAGKGYLSVSAFAQLFAEDNPAFDRARFLQDCKTVPHHTYESEAQSDNMLRQWVTAHLPNDYATVGYAPLAKIRVKPNDLVNRNARLPDGRLIVVWHVSGRHRGDSPMKHVLAERL